MNTDQNSVIVVCFPNWYSVCFVFILQGLALSCADKMITDKPDLSACAASEIAHFMLFGSSNDISWGLASLETAIFLPSVFSAFTLHLSTSWPPAKCWPCDSVVSVLLLK